VPEGPAPYIDLVSAESEREPVASTRLASLRTDPADIAVEVRGQFGDRWVDGFEICEVMTTPSGPRYRLRRQRDGLVLPELFDATNIRHDESFGRAHGEQTRPDDPREDAAGVSGEDPESEEVSGPPHYWSRS
jgi:hypothetical protein